MAIAEDRARARQAASEQQRELKSAVSELTEAARSATDPRDPIRDRPWPWLAGAFALGLWLGHRE